MLSLKWGDSVLFCFFFFGHPRHMKFQARDQIWVPISTWPTAVKTLDLEPTGLGWGLKLLPSTLKMLLIPPQGELQGESVLTCKKKKGRATLGCPESDLAVIARPFAGGFLDTSSKALMIYPACLVIPYTLICMAIYIFTSDSLLSN